MKTFLLLLLLLSIKLIYPQTDDRWYFFGNVVKENNISESYYYDTKTISSDNLYYKISVWVKIIPNSSYYNKIFDNYIDYILIKWVFYCKSRSMSSQDMVVYFTDASMKSDNSHSSTSLIIPDSIAESLFDIICK